ncbi:alpha/beta-hydrolase [Agrocybe pediades]|nr:alpha/beta-hydrolase [Agrocybe pediades]
MVSRCYLRPCNVSCVRCIPKERAKFVESISDGSCFMGIQNSILPEPHLEPPFCIYSAWRGITYFYTDTGPAPTPDYKTLVLVHGHTFHAGTFKRFSQLAIDSQRMRVICINRRHYPGTTPFSQHELDIIASGSNDDRAKLLVQQGIDMAMLIDALIAQCGIPLNGGVTLAGWSLGATFVLAMLAACDELQADVRVSLKRYLTGVVMWDMPSAALGLPDIPDAYSPLGDPSVPPEALPVAFGTWVSSFYTHGDFMTHGFSHINTAKPTQSTGDPATLGRLPTIQKLTPEDISTYIDFTLSTEHDTAILIAEEGGYRQVIYDLTQKALFDPQVRETWKGTKYYYLHSDCSPWAFVYSACALKEMCDLRKDSEEEKKYEVTFKCFKNANHFPMLEEPEVALHGLYDLLAGGSEHSGEEKSAVAESATVDSEDKTSSYPSQPWLAGAVNA